jgi:hypothetical protein
MSRITLAAGVGDQGSFGEHTTTIFWFNKAGALSEIMFMICAMAI